MTREREFDWNAWYQQFQLPPHYLADIVEWYPAILAGRQAGEGGDTVGVGLHPDLLLSLVASPRRPLDLEKLLESYAEAGEFGAATAVLEAASQVSDARPLELRRRMSQKQREFEVQVERARAQVSQSRDTLVNLGVLAPDDDMVESHLQQAEALYRQKRPGQARHILQALNQQLSQRVQQHWDLTRTGLTQLRQPVTGITPVLQTALERLLERVDQYLGQSRLELAERTLEQARVLVESRLLPPPEATPDPANSLILRSRFPDLTAQQIVDALAGKASVGGRAYAIFEKWWLPEAWKGAKQLTKADDRTFEALLDLARVAAPGAPFPYSRSNDVWRFFLRDLFDMLGLRNITPDQAEPLVTRSQRSGAAQMGFWLARCGPELSVRHTALDPARLRDGLPLVLWHRPNDPLCPKPASLQNELVARGLNDRPLVFVAGEVITPEDRLALFQAVPTAALLDQQDLLQILFCSDMPLVRAMHFARAIAWQLPPELASPFSEQGDVASSMFVGREDVLRKFIDPQGPTVLYGGRKLGKSSIFRQLQRTFQRQAARERLNIAIYVDAVSVVDELGIERTLLPQVTRQLNAALRQTVPAGLDTWMPIQPQIGCDDFANHIQRMLAALPQHRFLLLIDEADSLLQFLDAANDPGLSPAKRFGWTLRSLVAGSGGRFDVRFAGFQEISRAAQSTSGPFYNFRRGTPHEALTVLREGEARQLIRLPLQLLGVSFTDESLVDLILGFTGRHPALIQEFGKRLYSRLRGTQRQETASVRIADVEAIWHDPDFRRSVVKAIYLNVDTRNSKTEKLLRLLLFLWVRQIMAPVDSAALPTVVEPGDLYQLLTRTFPTSQVESQLKLSELDNHLADLTTLGVLERRGRGYFFRFRYFAGLLYYDHFGGQLGDNLLQELWESILTHETRPPRLQIRAGNELAVSPLTREAQQNLEQEQQRVVLALGAPGTGKTELFRWLQLEREKQRPVAESVRLLPATRLDLPELRRALGNMLDLPQTSDNWAALAAAAAARWNDASVRPTLVVVDDLDQLCRDPDWPLLSWPEGENETETDGPLFLLSHLTRQTGGRLRFVLTGNYPLARLWVETESLLAADTLTVLTQRLQPRERDGWFETSRLIAPPDIKQRVWELTAGDWRLLTALRQQLRAEQRVELNDAVVQRFAATLAGPLPSGPGWTALSGILDSYDPQIRAMLRAMGELATEWGPSLEIEMWADLLCDKISVPAGDQRSPLARWRTDLLTAAWLEDLALEHSSDGGDILSVPVNQPWFQLLVRYGT